MVAWQIGASGSRHNEPIRLYFYFRHAAYRAIPSHRRGYRDALPTQRNNTTESRYERVTKRARDRERERAVEHERLATAEPRHATPRHAEPSYAPRHATPGPISTLQVSSLSLSPRGDADSNVPTQLPPSSTVLPCFVAPLSSIRTRDAVLHVAASRVYPRVWPAATVFARRGVPPPEQ